MHPLPLQPAHGVDPDERKEPARQVERARKIADRWRQSHFRPRSLAGGHAERRATALTGLQDIDDAAGVEMSKWSCDVDGAAPRGL